MNLLLLRILFLIGSSIIGYQTLESLGNPLFGLLVGLAAALVIIALEIAAATLRGSAARWSGIIGNRSRQALPTRWVWGEGPRNPLPRSSRERS